MDTLNRRFDALFPSTAVNKDGVLTNIELGKHGIDMVIDYLEEVVKTEKDNTEFPWAATVVKIGRLYNSCKALR
jgi:hypothetical protein